jgi:serine/threonine protein kinase
MDPTDGQLIPSIIDQTTSNFLKMGYGFILTQKYEEANICFINAINSNPKNIDAWLNRGIISSILKKNDSLKNFEKSFKVGGIRFVNQRFATLYDYYQKNNANNLSFVKKNFELAKPLPRPILPILDRISKILKDVLNHPIKVKTPQTINESTHFPPELEQEYPDHIFYGEGGNAWVYRAKRKKDKLCVAIKIPKSFDKKASKRFIDEIANWRDLEHKNIVKIFDYSANPAHIVMEFFPKSLSQFELPMPTNEALKIILKVIDALSYAHKKGRIHNDIKPGNILLSTDNEPKLTDWGLGKLSGLSGSNYTSQTSYTPLYAAPEQLRFESVDSRTDIWQVGIVLYELITGKNPFADCQSENLYKIITSDEPVDPPSLINPNLKRMDIILMRCLEKDKTKRYQNIDDLTQEIEIILFAGFTEQTKAKNPWDRINARFDLIRLNSRKNMYDAAISNLSEIKKLPQKEHMQKIIDEEITAIYSYKGNQVPLEERMPNIEAIFTKFMENYIHET